MADPGQVLPDSGAKGALPGAGSASRGSHCSSGPAHPTQHPLHNHDQRASPSDCYLPSPQNPYSHLDLPPAEIQAQKQQGVCVRFRDPRRPRRGPLQVTTGSVLRQVTRVSMTEDHVNPTGKSRWPSQCQVGIPRPCQAGLQHRTPQPGWPGAAERGGRSGHTVCDIFRIGPPLPFVLVITQGAASTTNPLWRQHIPKETAQPDT